jgi:predicted dienelactone hydrolase
MKLIAILAAAMLLIAPAAARAGNVGFTQLTIPDGADKPLVVGIWYPTDAPASPHPVGTFIQDVAQDAPPSGDHLPLVVMSHGNGGSFEGHYDTAIALAKAGFVAAAVSHTGDTWDDQSHATDMWRRPAHIHRLIDYMLADWPHHGQIDPGKVGVFGFSSGGFTALVVAGGVPDFSTIAPHCVAHPDFFDCRLVSKAGVDVKAVAARLTAASWVHDPRVKAAVVAAPGLGFTFSREGLKDVRIPIQLWRDADDHILPNPYYAEAVRSALPQPPEFHLVDNADHFDFLAPCSDILRQHAPDICVSRPGFDRAAFHADFDAKVVSFFERTLN